MPSAQPAPFPDRKPTTEPWEAYIAELGRLDDLLQLTLNDQATCRYGDVEAADSRAHSVIQIVQDRIGQLVDRIEADARGSQGQPASRTGTPRRP